MPSLESNIPKMHLSKILRMFHFFGAVMVPFMTQWGGLSFFQIMVTQSVFHLSILIFEVPTGAIADKFGRKTSMIFSGLILTSSVIIYGLFPNFWIFCLAEIFFGIGFAFMSGSDEALIIDSLKSLGKENESKKVLARYFSIGGIGLIIAAPIGSWIAANYSLNLPMLLTAIPYFLLCVVALTLKEPEIKQPKKRNYWEQVFQGFRIIRSNKNLFIIALDSALFMFLSYTLFWLWQPVIMGMNFPILYFGFVAAAMNIFAILAATQLERIESFFKPRKTLFLLALVLGFCYIGMGLIDSVPVLIVLIILALGTRALRIPLLSHYSHKFIPSQDRATVISSIGMIRSLIIVVFNPLIGLLMEAGIEIAMITMGFAVLVFAFSSRIEEKMLE